MSGNYVRYFTLTRGEMVFINAPKVIYPFVTDTCAKYAAMFVSAKISRIGKRLEHMCADFEMP